jgi:hypothetical protein
MPVIECFLRPFPPPYCLFFVSFKEMDLCEKSSRTFSPFPAFWAVKRGKRRSAKSLMQRGPRIIGGKPWSKSRQNLANLALSPVQNRDKIGFEGVQARFKSRQKPRQRKKKLGNRLFGDNSGQNVWACCGIPTNFGQISLLGLYKSRHFFEKLSRHFVGIKIRPSHLFSGVLCKAASLSLGPNVSSCNEFLRHPYSSGSKIDPFVRIQIEFMQSLLNLYNNDNSKPRGQWAASSVQAAITLGKGPYLARQTRLLCPQFIKDRTVLP